MNAKTGAKTRSPLTTRQLIKHLQESGFTVELKREAVLLAESAKPNVRARQVPVYEQVEYQRAGRPAEIKGLIVPDSNTILINRSLPVNERVITAIHELIHLHSPELTENETEQEAVRLYRESNDHDLGYLEFLVS
ncbi:MAG: hypothetical protein Q7S64_01775 [bacterium]|nr:hypothetical protein [bacterium]